MNTVRDFEHPEQNEIDKIIYLVEKIRDIITDFLHDYSDIHFFRKNLQLLFNITPNTYPRLRETIKQNTYDAIGYVNSHRYDPSFKDAIRRIGFFTPYINTKIIMFEVIARKWIKVKKGHDNDKIKVEIIDVLFSEIDSILNGLAKVVQTLIPIVQINEQIQMGITSDIWSHYD